MAADGGLTSEEQITSPDIAAKLMWNYLKDSDREQVMVLTLDVKMQPLNVSVVSVGTVDNCPVHAREIFKTAILSNATGILMMHNHPSGDCTPSKEDFEVTQKMEQAGEILGICLYDHIVVGAGTYYSFRENNLVSAQGAVPMAAEGGN